MESIRNEMVEGRSISSACPGIGYAPDLVLLILGYKAIDFEPFLGSSNCIWVGALQKEWREEGKKEKWCLKFS